MNPSAITRILTGCSWRAQRHLLRFAWDGHRAVRAFERRMKRGEPFFPAFLMLSITNRCNLKCHGCWVSQTTPPCMLSLRQMQGIVDAAAKYRSRFFGILGGEPLFHPDLLTLFRNNPKAYFQLYTNGTMFDAKLARELAALGNVTPLISIEGMETESRRRRGRDDVFARSMAGLDESVKAGLFTGVTASINMKNFDELVSHEYLDFLVSKGVHYIWYFIYRPCGPDPEYENALDRDHVLKLRQFLVEQRRTAKIVILDAYWDAEGHAQCPGAMGLSHHISPNGAVEFCPIMQAAGGHLNADASNLEAIFQQETMLAGLRKFSASQGRDCMVIHSPHELLDNLKANSAEDSSGRDGFFRELAERTPMCCHDVPGGEIPEQSAAYRFGKRNYFFGFGAYG